MPTNEERILTRLEPLDSTTATKLKRHIQKTLLCQACDLHQTKTNYVIGRGVIPSDILFIGEAPGPTEDVLATPFCGPSGKLLEELIAHTETLLKSPFTYSITNTISCIPLNAVHRIRVPSNKEKESCLGRLLEFIHIANPRGIIQLGKVSEFWWRDAVVPLLKQDYPTLAVYHPAYLIRQGARVDKHLLFKRWCVSVAEFIHSLRPRQSDTK